MNIDSFIYLDRVRKIAMQLPGVTESTCFGTPAFYVNKKLFARMKEKGDVLVIHTIEREIWMKKDYNTFFITDHYKNYSYMLIALATVGTTDLKTLITSAWRNRAGKKLLKEWEI